MNSKFAFFALIVFALAPLGKTHKTFFFQFYLVSFFVGSLLICYYCSTEEPGNSCKHPTETTVTIVNCLENRICYSRFIVFSSSILYYLSSVYY